MNLRRLALVLGTFIAHSAVFADCQLQDSDATYDLFARSKHVGEVRQQIQVDNKHYYIENKTKVGFFFLSDRIEENIKGNVDGGVYQPSSYTINDARKSNEMSWQFLPEKKLIKGYIGKHYIQQHQSSWPVYDTTSYQLALRCALKQGSFSHATYHVFSEGKMMRYDVKVLANKKVIHTRHGKFNATEVRVLIVPGGHLALLWFANDHDYLLVQSSLLQGKDGSVFTSVSEAKIK